MKRNLPVAFTFILERHYPPAKDFPLQSKEVGIRMPDNAIIQK